jgi:hypothetical protein
MAHRPQSQFLLSIFLLTIISAGAAFGAPAINAKCLACHGPGSTAAPKARIETRALELSAHSGLGCTDCHAGALGQGEAGLPHLKKLPDVNCTERCHRELAAQPPGLSPLFYPDSVHGQDYRQNRTTEAAKCWDCHGKHSILGIDSPESTVNRRNIPLTCSRCHEDMKVVLKYNIHQEAPYQEYLKSVHGQSPAAGTGEPFAAVCTDCHGIHDIQGVGRGEIAARKPETCGRCHQAVFSQYRDSIHGRVALQGNVDAPLCVDCHGEHTIASPRDKNAPTFATHIADTCSACHARPEIMKKYGIPEDKISTFIESLHGIAVGLGYKAAANCTSCHGVHDIRPASDPLSFVNPARLAQTCGQPKCHPGMPAKIALAKIHVDVGLRKSGVLFWVQTILLGLILLVTLITLLWFIPGFIRKARLLKKRK